MNLFIIIYTNGKILRDRNEFSSIKNLKMAIFLCLTIKKYLVSGVKKIRLIFDNIISKYEKKIKYQQ